MKIKNKIIGFPHPPQSHGGPGNFQVRLEMHLKDLGWRVVYPEDKVLPEVILVVGGTKKINWLWACKRKGVRIVHRLDGMNWLHRIQPVSFHEKLHKEIINRILTFIRNHFADHIIYQSVFVKDWWEKICGVTKCPSSIIYNAVDLNEFCPQVNAIHSENSTTQLIYRQKKSYQLKPNLICVEGIIDYSPYALVTLEFLAKELKGKLIDKVLVYGEFKNSALKNKFPEIDFCGYIGREDIHKIYRNGIYLSLDVNAACPNAVIEALSSGCPVIGYDTGSLKELVKEGAGIIVPYGSDPWRLNEPDCRALFYGMKRVLSNFYGFSQKARESAVMNFGITDLVEKYIYIFNNFEE